jgi:LCP family protein required for cell wall assembly
MMRNLLFFVLCVVVLAVGFVYRKSPAALQAGTAPVGTVLDPLPPPFPGKQMLRLVLIGADDRPGNPGRSDTLMCLMLNPERNRAALLSFPRDLRVEIPGHGATKINHAYHYGGADLTRRTVEGVLGTDTDGYIRVGLDGFVKAVDILGGVVLDVEDVEGKGRGMNYDCPQDGLVIHLKPGRQRLTGYKAMGYVRYRKSNIPGCGGTDFDRAERQQKFVRAMVEQKVRPWKLSQLCRAGVAVLRCIRSTLSFREVVDLGRCLRTMGSGGLKSATVPTLDAKIGGTYYCVVDEDKYPAVMADLESHLAATPAPLMTPRVDVLNASGKAGAATKAADALRAKGFEVLQVGNAPKYGLKQTVILYRVDGQEAAAKVAEALGCGVLEADDSGPTPPGYAHVQVQVGLDYAP